MDRSAAIRRLFGPRALFLANVGLLLFLAVLLAQLFWSVAALLREPQLPLAPPLVESGGGTQSEPGYNVQALLAVPLFGVPPVAATDEQQIQKDVKRSRLKITVLGLVAGSGERGVAILRHGNKTKAYGIGEKIDVAGSVSLLAVMADHIIIENNRKQEKIELQKRGVHRGVSTSAAPSAPAAQVINLNQPDIRKLIGNPRETVRNSPLRLARFFAASPAMDNGRLIGYELKPGRDTRLFKLLDLQAGDIVLSINGQSLADLPTVELMKLMETTQSFELLVQRNDTILSKRLEI